MGLMGTSSSHPGPCVRKPLGFLALGTGVSGGPEPWCLGHFWQGCLRPMASPGSASAEDPALMGGVRSARLRRGFLPAVLISLPASPPVSSLVVTAVPSLLICSDDL